MSDPFSIAAGAIGIATAFSACIDCFNYIQLGRHFGRDYETCVLLLGAEKMRLARWGEAIHVDQDPKLNGLDGISEETQMAKRTLLQILMLFADTDNISKKHKPSAKAGDDLSALTTNELNLAVAAWRNKMKEMSVKRQGTSSFLKRTSWAIHHKPELEELTANIRKLIDNLEMFFPAPKPQLEPTGNEKVRSSSDQSLQSLGNVSCDVERTIRSGSMEAILGHHYSNISVDGKAQVGDTFSEDWQGAHGRFHSYHGVLVGSSGKALIGNKYGGKGFWDD
ncbi:small s protein [Xylaria cf. heliscus]|nr:small s protein [Xylaria cf. heliscus]